MLPEGNRLAMAQAFAHLLGNTLCLQRTALTFEWNARGPFSAEAVPLFHHQAVEMFRAQEKIASRIRMMGEVVTPDESDLVLSVTDQTVCLRKPDVLELVGILASGHDRIILSIRAASDVAVDVDDRGALTVLDARLVAHEQHLARLEEFRL